MSVNQKVRISNTQFITIVEAIRNRREVIEGARGLAEVVEVIAKDLDFVISENAVKQACNFLGIKLKKRPPSANYKRSYKGRVSTLSRAVANLYRELGIKVPDDLAEIVRPHATPPVPVAAVPPASTLQVAGKPH